jgi:hypothetical protein
MSACSNQEIGAGVGTGDVTLSTDNGHNEYLIDNKIIIGEQEFILPMLLDDFLSAVNGIRDYSDIPTTFLPIEPFVNEYASILIPNGDDNIKISATVYHDFDGNYFLSGLTFGGGLNCTEIANLPFSVSIVGIVINEATMEDFDEYLIFNEEKSQTELAFTFTNIERYTVHGIFEQNDESSKLKTITITTSAYDGGEAE